VDKSDFSIISESDLGFVEEKSFFTYSEEERQELEINKANAKLVFSPKFIPVYPELLDKGLTLTEALIFGFIYFFKGHSTGRFYFTNEQLSKIAKCSEETVSRAVSRLKDLKMLNISYKIKANGGKIRFVNDILYDPDLTICSIRTCENVVYNKNNIKDNKINTYTSISEKDNSLNNTGFKEENALEKQPKDTPLNSATPPLNDYMDLWNNLMPNKIMSLSSKRRTKLISRIKNDNNYNKRFIECLKKIKESDFLSGKNGGWKATFDWLIDNDTNYIKVLEDTYANAGQAPQKSSFQSELEKIRQRYEGTK